MNSQARHLIQLFAVLFAMPVAVSVAQLIPPDRLPPPGTWESAGVEGGIPHRRTIFADVTQPPYSADATGRKPCALAIQSAIDACPSNQVVYLPPGSYLIESRLRIRRSITLRGAGKDTVLLPVPEYSSGSEMILMGGLGPWPPPKNNAAYYMDVTGAARESASVTVANASLIEVGKMIMIDEVDNPALVWAKSGFVGRCRGSMHMVETKAGNTVAFRPPLPIDYTRSPRLSRFPDLVQKAGVEDIKFVGNGSAPGLFIAIQSAWNVWVKGCEFSDMPAKTIMVAWAGHVELRKNYMHDQSNGGPNSEGLDFLNDTNWSLIADNICVAGGFPQINIGDSGAGSNYSGGFGNVIAYNYAVDSFYTDPPASPDHWIMTHDISVNHSPHSQFNLVEGNYMNKFGADSYHGSGSHAILLRNVVTGRNRWSHAVYRTAVQIDRRNTFYALIGNVLGEAGKPASREYVAESGWPASSSAIFRLGFPNMGNQGFSGTYPPTPLAHADGGPRDLYVDRNNAPNGTTIIEGNWTSVKGFQDWTIKPAAIPKSLYLANKPGWFGSLPWPPIDPENPKTDDPTIIPAGYRYRYGTDPPGVDEDGDGQAADSSPQDSSKHLRIADPRFISSNAFQVEWNSKPDQVYAFQFTTNLLSWSSLTNITATAFDSIWVDRTASMEGKRFYRIRTQD